MDVKAFLKRLFKALGYIANDKTTDPSPVTPPIPPAKTSRDYPLPKPRVVKVTRIKRKRRSMPAPMQSNDPRFNHSLRRFNEKQ